MPWVSPGAVIVAFLVMGFRESVVTHSLCHGFLPKLLVLDFWSWVIGICVYSQPVPWVSPQAVIVAFLVMGYRESVFTHSPCHRFLPKL